MTIQQTLESLLKRLPHDEAAELRTLIQEWPTDDPELQQLIEAHTGDILTLFQQSSPEAVAISHEQETSLPSFPTLSNVISLAHLN